MGTETRDAGEKHRRRHDSHGRDAQPLSAGSWAIWQMLNATQPQSSGHRCQPRQAGADSLGASSAPAMSGPTYATSRSRCGAELLLGSCPRSSVKSNQRTSDKARCCPHVLPSLGPLLHSSCSVTRGQTGPCRRRSPCHVATLGPLPCSLGGRTHPHIASQCHVWVTHCLNKNAGLLMKIKCLGMDCSILQNLFMYPQIICMLLAVGSEQAQSPVLCSLCNKGPQSRSDLHDLEKKQTVSHSCADARWIWPCRQVP